jgi:hypothetical protein
MSKHISVVKLTSPTSGGRSVGIVRLRTKATELQLKDMGYYLIVKKLVPSLGTLFLGNYWAGPQIDLD